MVPAIDLVKELDYWIHINVANDIVDCKDNRLEYQAYVKIAEENQTDKVLIPYLVLGMLMLKSEQENKSLINKIKRLYVKVIALWKK